MRILLTTPHPLWPASSGSARRTLSIAAALGRNGHRVTLLAPGKAEPPATADGGALPATVSSIAYRGLGAAGHFFNPFFTRALTAALAAGQDLVVAAYPYQAADLNRACGRFDTALVYDAHNCEEDRFRQLWTWPVARMVARAESQLVAAARTVLCVSEADRGLFRSRYGVDGTLLPNGVETSIFCPAAPDPGLLRALGLEGKRVILFFGSFDYEPNRRALQRLLSLDWPIASPGQPDCHLLVVGRDGHRFTPARRGLQATGEVDDIIGYIRLANLVVAPLEAGGGTRLKIVEALACAQPVLATPFGAQGLSSRPIPGLTCREWPDFGEALARLLEEPLPPGGNTGGRQWAQTVDWDSLVRAIHWEALADRPGFTPQ